MVRIAPVLLAALLLAPSQPAAQQGETASPAASPLDYEVFKSRVQPILMSPRKGNARCIA
jgi:hypothetical protein